MKFILLKTLLIVTIYNLQFTISFSQSQSKKSNQKSFQENYLKALNEKLSVIILEDQFSAPQTTRIYAYPNIAAYEVLVNSDKEHISLVGQLSGLVYIQKPDSLKYDWDIAATVAYISVANSLVFSQQKWLSASEIILRKVKKNTKDSLSVKRSMMFGNLIAKHIINWAKEDGYEKRKVFPRYSLLNKKGTWEPTPPDYKEAIEPNWRTLRPYVLDSAAQFKSDSMTVFSEEKNSDFYKLAMDVYSISKKNNSQEKDIAIFWDDNPKKSEPLGHLTLFKFRISPGGHWILIASQAAKIKKLSSVNTAEILALTAIAIYDGTLSCWDEKYRSNRIRPVSFITKNIDEKWQPFLQTPYFPEYTSGHSVASMAAAIILTNKIGEKFAFADSSQLEFVDKPRKYKSFINAANEAGISRVYGGIHFKDGCKDGLKQGELIGSFILKRIKTKN